MKGEKSHFESKTTKVANQNTFEFVARHWLWASVTLCGAAWHLTIFFPGRRKSTAHSSSYDLPGGIRFSRRTFPRIAQELTY
jgi:hypothetical protein